MTSPEISFDTNNNELQRLVELAKLDIPLPVSFPLQIVHTLNLTGCGLCSLPQDFEKAFPNLSILFLSNNHFQEVPEVIGKCSKLQMVAFKSNQLETIHPEALQCQLRWLILTDNRISTIPDTIGRCTLLQKCMLSGNRLQTLPQAMEQCINLELIRLASNQLKEPPMVLLQLPKLAWIALSDNPFLQHVLKAHDVVSSNLPVLEGDLDESNDDEILGQGASGITRKCMYQGESVAVKTYHTDICITSDGLPEEERRINCAAAVLQHQCPAFIRILGQTINGSLVMEYLEDYEAIADPPSFDSCSRDVYPHKSLVHQLNREQALTIVSELLQALTELHRLGICHGDFYGHNILVCANDLSKVRLSDFGAAFFYDKQSELYGNLLQRIELRAFAIWVEEVAAFLESGSAVQTRFHELVERCRQENPSSENNFERVFIWWKQKQLADIAKEFDFGLHEEITVEEKEPN